MVHESGSIVELWCLYTMYLGICLSNGACMCDCTVAYTFLKTVVTTALSGIILRNAAFRLSRKLLLCVKGHSLIVCIVDGWRLTEGLFTRSVPRVCARERQTPHQLGTLLWVILVTDPCRARCLASPLPARPAILRWKKVNRFPAFQSIS